MKVMLLSNVNVRFINYLLSKKLDIVPNYGYGNIWAQLLEKNHYSQEDNADIIVFLIDLDQLVKDINGLEDKLAQITSWFSVFESIELKSKEYFISDLGFRNNYINEIDSFEQKEIYDYWIVCLKKQIANKNNVHLLPINNIMIAYGRNLFFSRKLWYWGNIPYSYLGSEKIAETIEMVIQKLVITCKKVLVLDLDNTLWGGIIGEKGYDGIDLGDNNIGAVYREIQCLLKQMKKKGVLLAVVSKNNECDVQEVWEKNPYMVLNRDDFVSHKINWNNKVDNIREIAAELNLGLDSFVFIDDTLEERENIIQRLPEVVVPSFPSKLEDYPHFIYNIYILYFQNLRSSAEDLRKTQLYLENKERNQLLKRKSFEEFLLSLQMKIRREDLNNKNIDRIVQLIGKVNQFNLTTKRYSRIDLEKMQEKDYNVYAYRLKDRYGDYGIIAVAIINKKDNPCIENFLMSCRAMGKGIEKYIINDLEEELLKSGYSTLFAEYIPTAKNGFLHSFYNSLGYSVESKMEYKVIYKINLCQKNERINYVSEWR